MAEDSHAGALAATAGVICAVGLSIGLRAASTREAAAFVPVLAWIAVIPALLATRARPSLAMAVGAGLACRLVLVDSPPWLSDDLYRYLFEGQALLAGHNPFVSAPSTLPGLNPELLAHVNHPDIPSIYPPGALVWFAGLAVLGDQPWIAQLAAALVDTLTVGLVWQICTTRGRPAWPALVYAVHPLPVLESGSGAHVEIPALALMAGAILANDRGGRDLAGFLAALSGGTKLLPFGTLPAFRAGPRGIAVGIAVLALIALPVLGAGAHLFDALRLYTTTWSFVGFAYTPLWPILGDWTRPVLGAIGLVCVVAAQRHRDPLDTWVEVGTAFYLLTPTAHPWYALFAALPRLIRGDRWAAFTFAAPIGAYAVLRTFDAATGAWTEDSGLWAAVWGPFVLGMIASIADRPPTHENPTANSSKNGSDSQ